jgi:glutamyl/glutaminyl-tRNA synthetase
MSFNKVNLEQIIMPLTENYGIGDLLWPLRTALSGKRASPGPFEILEVLGKKESLKRIKSAINKLKING